jgi:hypothetical protein
MKLCSECWRWRVNRLIHACEVSRSDVLEPQLRVLDAQQGMSTDELRDVGSEDTLFRPRFDPDSALRPEEAAHRISGFFGLTGV